MVSYAPVPSRKWLERACASDRLIGLASLTTRPTRPSSAHITVRCTAWRLSPSVA